MKMFLAAITVLATIYPALAGPVGPDGKPIVGEILLSEHVTSDQLLPLPTDAPGYSDSLIAQFRSCVAGKVDNPVYKTQRRKLAFQAPKIWNPGDEAKCIAVRTEVQTRIDAMNARNEK
jgi:hypothetical protein